MMTAKKMTKRKTASNVVHVDAMTLVGQAVQNGAQVEQVEKLIELVKFNDKREAIRAFNRAFTHAQAEFPEVPKTKKAYNGTPYAPYPEVVKAIRPVLIQHGLSFRHEIVENEGTVKITCILAHEDGHSETSSLSAPPDTSGSKNLIQSIGSSVTYLKRYTLEAVTGIVTGNDDDDGAAAGEAEIKYITEDQVEALGNDIEGAGHDESKVFNWLKKKGIESYEQIPAESYAQIRKALKL